jgi:MFS family permease
MRHVLDGDVVPVSVLSSLRMAFRVALFYGSYAIATAFGGLIAYGCFHINGSLYGWLYLFIIEGVGSIVVALATPFWLPADPATAWFFTPTERRYAGNRMTIDADANFESTHKITKRDIKEALLDWKLWLMTPANILQGISPMGLTIFFPIVVKVSCLSTIRRSVFERLL